MSNDIKLHKALAFAFSREVMTAQQIAEFIAIYRSVK